MMRRIRRRIRDIYWFIFRDTSGWVDC